MMNRPFVIAFATAAAFVASSAAWAQPTPNPAMAAVRAACAADYAKLCPDAKTQDDRRQCMMTNADKFSDACKAALADARAKMQAAPPPASPQGGTR